MANNNSFQVSSNFNIIEFAKNILDEVDKIRSYSINTDLETKTQNNRPIESRVNAFFRLIGLPAFVSVEKKNPEEKPANDLSGERVLSPGFFGGKFNQYTIGNTEKDDIFGILLNREGELLSIENKIGTKEMNSFMTQALKIPIPLTPELIAKVGPDGNILTDDKSNIQNSRKVYKKLLPLITSYLDVMPVKNQISRPFVTDIKDQMPDNETVLPRPFLETVIRIRTIVANAESESSNDAIKIAKDFIKRNIGDVEYKKISSSTDNILSNISNNNIIENLIIDRLLSIIPELAKKWYELQKYQEFYMKKIDFIIDVKTDSAKNSPFGKRIDISANIDLNNNLEIGKKLKILKRKLAKDQAIQLILPTNDNLYGNNSKEGINNTSNMSLLNSLVKLITPDIDKTQNEINNIENSIKKASQGAEKLRLNVEMMTGEFTGLSIVDVIAVITSLFLIEKDYLTALLDTDVKNDMKKDSVLSAMLDDLGNLDGINATKTAINNLELIVKWFFNILNATIKNTYDKSARSNFAVNLQREVEQKVSMDDLTQTEE